MGSRATPWLVIGVLAVFALRPVDVIEQLLARLTSPLRYVAQVTLPVRLAAARSVAAADSLAVDGLREEAVSRDALEALYAVAETERPDLVAGRRQVPAVVTARDPRDRDRIVVRPWTLLGVRVGQPVVHREAYVGRVTRVDRGSGQVEVDLVTGDAFFVGARVLADDGSGEPLHLVVGGLAAERRIGGEPLTWLVAHNPSRRPREGAQVVVSELLDELDPLAELAEGYSLGVLEHGRSEDDWRVRPELDFLHGLYHVVVLTSAADDLSEPEAPDHPLRETRWVQARALTAGDPSPWRRSLQLDVGTLRGVRPGAAVVRGARLVGRVGAVSDLGAELRLLSDPGLSLPTVGRPIGTSNPSPRVLGRMVGLGARADGLPRFHWRDVTLPPLAPDEPAPAPVPMRLFTGSGELGLPAGLLIGEAELPLHSSEGRGHPVVLAEPLRPGSGDERLWVRVESGDPLPEAAR